MVNTAEAAIEAATAGLAITRVLSYQITDAVRSGKLAIALEKFEPSPSPVKHSARTTRNARVEDTCFFGFCETTLAFNFARYFANGLEIEEIIILMKVSVNASRPHVLVIEGWKTGPVHF